MTSFSSHYDGFISHAGSDTDTGENVKGLCAYPLYQEAKKQKLRFFLDRENLKLTAPSWEILRALAVSKVGIVIISKAFWDGITNTPVSRPWCLLELRVLLARHKLYLNKSVKAKVKELSRLFIVVMEPVHIDWFCPPKKLPLVEPSMLGLEDMEWTSFRQLLVEEDPELLVLFDDSELMISTNDIPFVSFEKQHVISDLLSNVIPRVKSVLELIHEKDTAKFADGRADQAQQIPGSSSQGISECSSDSHFQCCVQ